MVEEAPYSTNMLHTRNPNASAPATETCCCSPAGKAMCARSKSSCCGCMQIRNIVTKEGVKGLYAGYGAFMLRDLPFDAIEFVAYEQLKKAYARSVKRDLQTAEVSIVGAAAGGITGARACWGFVSCGRCSCPTLLLALWSVACCISNETRHLSLVIRHQRNSSVCQHEADTCHALAQSSMLVRHWLLDG